MANIYAVIMAGGRGERFWPLSASTLPKPFIPLLGKTSLFQQTAERIQKLVPIKNILISIGAEHFEIARKQLPQLPEENFIVEPIGRDTSACIAYCALHIEKRDPEALMIALPADHFVSNIDGYVKTLQLGIENLQEASGIVFGISPARPETGYGYVLTDASSSVSGALNVIRFVEKPNAEKAAEFLASGDYYWNSGMFLWKNSTLLDLFRQHMPEFYGSMCILRSLLGTDSGAEINKVFSSLPRISIDFGIMEKTAGLKLVPAQFIWDDIGNWASLERALPADSQGNIAQGSHIALESSRCILYAQSETIAAFGVTDLVIVQAYGQVLVCPKSKTGDLKRLVSALAARIL